MDGALRALFFLGYIFLISRMKDIHRVFQYHGAEHKVVFAWEKQVPLTVENARAQSRLHPRCGTSFLLFVLLVSILVFAFIPKTAPFLVKFGGRLLLVPAIAGLSYEVLRFTAKHRAAPLFAAAGGAGARAAADHHPGADRRHAGGGHRRARRGAARGRPPGRRDGPRMAADPVAVAAGA